MVEIIIKCKKCGKDVTNFHNCYAYGFFNRNFIFDVEEIVCAECVKNGVSLE